MSRALLSGCCLLFLRGWVGVGAPGCRSLPCAWFEAGAGSSSRQPSHFLLLRQKKVTKEKATPLAATLRFATGNLRCSLFAGSAQTRCAQTRAALIREKLRSSARPEGTWNSTRHGASLCGMQVRVSSWSSLTLAVAHMHTHTHTHTHEYELARARARARARAQARACGDAHARAPVRTQTHAPIPGLAQRGRWWPSEAMARPVSNPLCACRGAQLFAEKGPRVFEPQASLRGPRVKRAPQVARSEAEGHAQWGRLFFGYFLLAKQKKVTRPPGRHPGSSLNTSTRYQSTDRCPHPKPSPGGRGSKT
ncbi:hypothetical protein H6CHR_03556 [Variovorax sp. PBL-H6]|nr:hypothetical protein H6CHR_03556 [Variovorax sp. PBL-H6]